MTPSTAPRSLLPVAIAVVAAPSQTLPVAAVVGPAPVVRNAKGQKRRPDGKACEALDDLGQPCGSFFSSSWYAQNRCCASCYTSRTALVTRLLMHATGL